MTESGHEPELGETDTEPDAEPGTDAEPDAAAEPAAEQKSDDVEGPRRRARREREERRAAQARATAIGDARREAKRRVRRRPEQEAKTLGRGTVRGLKLLMWTAVIAVLVVGLGLLLYFTPIRAARSIAVAGLGAASQAEVGAAAGAPPGPPLLQVDTDSVAERVAEIRRVASARVQRE